VKTSRAAESKSARRSSRGRRGLFDRSIVLIGVIVEAVEAIALIAVATHA